MRKDKEIINLLENSEVIKDKLKMISLYYVIKSMIKEDIDLIYGNDISQDTINAAFQLTIHQIEQTQEEISLNTAGQVFLHSLLRSDLSKYQRTNNKIINTMKNMNELVSSLEFTEQIAGSKISFEEQVKLSKIVISSASNITNQTRLLGKDKEFTKELVANVIEQLMRTLQEDNFDKTITFEEQLMLSTKDILLEKHTDENLFSHTKQDIQVRGFVGSLTDEEKKCWEYESIYELSGYAKDSLFSVLENKTVREDIALLMDKDDDEIVSIGHSLVRKRLNYSHPPEKKKNTKDMVKLFRKEERC